MVARWKADLIFCRHFVTGSFKRIGIEPGPQPAALAFEKPGFDNNEQLKANAAKSNPDGSLQGFALTSIKMNQIKSRGALTS